MFDLIYATSLFGLVQLAICTVLTFQALRWARRHPLGADGRVEFFPLQIGSLLTGLITAITAISFCGLPVWGELTKGDTNALITLGVDAVACLSIVPAAGLLGCFARKANIVVLLSAVGILPSLGAVALTPYMIFIGSASC